MQHNIEGKKKRGGKLTWRGGSWRPGWWCTVKLEVVRPAACTGHGWKKKEQSPAKEKESSRLELLVWLRRELLPRLPLGRKRASGQGGGRCLCCCRCCWSRNGRGGNFYREERERSGATITRDGFMATGGGDDGEKPGDEGGGGWRPRWREKAEKGLFAGKMNTEGLFSANCELDFPPLLSMKSAPIYRGGKRVILYSPGKKSQPLIRLEESKPSVQSVHLELPNLAVQGCRLPKVATLGQSTEPFRRF